MILCGNIVAKSQICVSPTDKNHQNTDQRKVGYSTKAMTDIYDSGNYLQSDLHSDDVESVSSYLKSPSESIVSTSDNEAASINQNNTKNIPNALAGLPISRPLSRCSVTSGLSITATKDGVEGKRVKRSGIPGYPLNLMNKMYANYASKQANAEQSQLQQHLGLETPVDHLVAGDDDGASVVSLSSMIPQYSPDFGPSGSERANSLNDVSRDTMDYTPSINTVDDTDGTMSHVHSVNQHHTLNENEGESLDDYSRFLKETSDK